MTLGNTIRGRVAVAPNGDMYTAACNPHSINKLSGSSLTKITLSLTCPWSIAAAGTGNIYVIGRSENVVLKSARRAAAET